jgi:hypothetical protein
MTGHRAALTLIVALSGCTAATPAGAPQPQDYANGVEISIASNEPFFQVPMPQFVAESAVRPDLGDVAVFNGDGAAVPFARVDAATPTAASTRLELRSFRLDADGADGSQRIELDTDGDNIQLRVAPTRTASGGTEYVLALQDSTDRPVERLHLAWMDDSRNWRQSVTVSTSNDLRTWATVAHERPIMDLRAGSERLQHNEIEIDHLSPPYTNGRFWRMQFGPGFVPVLTSVTAEIRGEALERPGLVLTVATSAAPDGSAVYTLLAPQPVWRLHITPADANSVLPLQIDGRTSDGAWRPLRATVAFRLNSQAGEQRSNPVILGGELVKAIRLRPIGTSFGSPPFVQVERPLKVLVVNARGSGPFLLAWGSRSARDAALAVETLVPSWNSGSLARLPEGMLGQQQVLGGPSRLTELSPAERTAQWQTTLVWVLLIAGAGGLGLLAWRVWKDTAAAGQ